MYGVIPTTVPSTGAYTFVPGTAPTSRADGEPPSSLYQTCVPPPQGIIAWWPFDETTGTIANDIAGEHPGAWFDGPAPVTPLARTAGLSLAVTALVLAFAAAAQTSAYDPSPGTTGILPWVFAMLVGAAIVAIFLFVLWVVRAPQSRSPDRPPGAARHRT